MTMLTDVQSNTKPQTKGESRFSAFALILSFALAMLGLFSAQHPRPDAATGDPFLFVMRP